MNAHEFVVVSWMAVTAWFFYQRGSTVAFAQRDRFFRNEIAKYVRGRHTLIFQDADSIENADTEEERRERALYVSGQLTEQLTFIDFAMKTLGVHGEDDDE